MLGIITTEMTLLLRLIAAILCGGLIGWERSSTNHDAGLRTHIIVCLGAASIMVVSECLTIRYNIPNEIMRMGAQVISGVGFLGAGSIIVDGNRIRGITTAAGIWTTACIGIVVGAGLYLTAFVIVAMMLFTMLVLRKFAHRIHNTEKNYTIKFEVRDRESFGNVLHKLRNMNVDVKKIRTADSDDKTLAVVALIAVPVDGDINAVICETGIDEGVHELEIV